MTARTVAEWLANARTAGVVDRLDAQLLLARALGRPRTWLLAHADEALPATAAQLLQTWLERHAAGEPLAYLFGEKEFHGLLLKVDASVLVPRADTEVLVDWALDLLIGELAAVAQPRAIDLGTGSGAIALAAKHGHPAAQWLATDVSAAALAVARGNAERLGLALDFRVSAWWQAFGDDERFRLVVSNPPYIAAGDRHLDALRFEPTIALTPGGDGLDALRDIIAGAPAHLEPGGWLLLEHGFDQAGDVAALLQVQGFTDVQTRIDLAGHPRCTGGSWQAS